MSRTEVVGGVGGLEVQYDELGRASKRLAGEGADLLGLAVLRHRMLADGDLLASAVLSPSGFARVEAALVCALDGPDGVVAAGVVLERRAGQLLVAIARYRASDVLEGEADRARRWLMAAAAPVLLPSAVLGGVGWAATVVARGDNPLTELQRALVTHPGVVDEVLGAVTGVTSALGSGLAGPLPVFADQAFRAVTGRTCSRTTWRRPRRCWLCSTGPAGRCGRSGSTSSREPAWSPVVWATSSTASTTATRWPTRTPPPRATSASPAS
jgi:hypothetical protein